MALLRSNPAMEAALCTHAENARHELAGYVAAWHPDHEYGVVMRACANYIQSDATGTRLPEFDMGVEPSHNSKVRKGLQLLQAQAGHTLLNFATQSWLLLTLPRFRSPARLTAAT